jgi:glutathione S-transferase
MKFDIAAKSILLKTSSGLITQHVPILRYIAEIAPNARLMGANTFDSALVNQWLEFSWCELGMQVNNHHQNRLPNLIFSLPFSSRGPITTVASNPFRYL